MTAANHLQNNNLRACGWCGATFDQPARTCPFCGGFADVDLGVCPACQEQIAPEDTCPECGEGWPR